MRSMMAAPATWYFRGNAFDGVFFAGPDLLDQVAPRVGILAVTGLITPAAMAREQAPEVAQAQRLAAGAENHLGCLLEVVFGNANSLGGNTGDPALANHHRGADGDAAGPGR